jgi:hypothetical protein
VGETRPFRKLVREVPIIDDEIDNKVIEIGSSYGECLQILAKRTKNNAIGFEISEECVSSSITKYPILVDKATGVSCVYLCDALSHQGASLIEEHAAHSHTAFVDIGGDRHAEAVIHLCHVTLTHPRQIVIKCRLLFREARKLLMENKELFDVKHQLSAAAQSPGEGEVSSDVSGGGDGDGNNDVDTINHSLEKSEETLDEAILRQAPLVDSILSKWWCDLVERINSNGLESGAAGLGAPGWYKNQPKFIMKANLQREKMGEEKKKSNS